MSKFEKTSKFRKALESPKKVNPKATFNKMTTIEGLPGVESSSDFSERAALSKPTIEMYENKDILRKNKKISMQELGEILGLTKVVLPVISTRIETVPLVEVKSKSPARATSPSKSKKSPSRAKSPKRFCKVMVNGKPVQKEMISTDRSTKAKPVYKIEDLKDIAKQLNISSTGTKEVIVDAILKELENIGC